ncbi:hypothetical protein O1R50_15220 [Glycomyces luteolus]|uniref:LppP/LprE lipoprotein n=1 Tax=Glycomyces luteolus TaxID=2670330 RepID=A0A9X3PLR6_9ACTN|nr:hypothetical protein [Glycomyces luteolus]MDA1360980.1 hypothetical protein [Glycomyces luteolus]
MQVRRWISAGAVVCALFAAGGCGIAGGGVRVAEDAGEGTTGPVPDSQPHPAEGEAFSIDPVAVLREDPEVRQDIKDLVARPCTGEGYDGSFFPVETAYATVAGTDVQVVVVNVLGCTSPYLCASGYASYVYRLWQDGPEQVFAAEEVSTTVMVTEGEFTLERQVWLPGDTADCPTGLESVPLTWDGDALAGGG